MEDASPAPEPPGRWPRATLRTYLVTMILLATVPLAVLMSWQIAHDLRRQQARIDERLAATVTALAGTVERELASSIDALTILSYADTLQAGDLAAFESRLTERPLGRPSWRGVFLADDQGRVLFDSGGHPERAHDPDRALLRRALDEGQPAVSDLVDDGARPATVVEVPVRVGGQPRYLLGAWIDAASWQQLLERAAPPAQGFLALFDGRRRLIARTAEPGRFVGQRLPAPLVQAIAARGAGETRDEVLDGTPAYVGWRLLAPGPWGVAAALHAEPVETVQARAIAGALGIAAACLLLGVTLALLAAHRLARPLRALAEGRPAPVGAPVREVAQLRDALAAAAWRDEAARERLQTKADEFETLFAASPIGLAFAQDPACREVLHNVAMDRLFGELAAHALGDVQVLERGRVLERAEQPLQRAAARGEAVPLTELEVRIEGREPTWVLANAVPLRGPHGQPRGAIGAVVDISEQKRTEARLHSADRQLRESQHLIDLAQAAGHVGFFRYRFESDLLTWTPGLASLFGFVLAELPQASSPLDEWLRRIDRADRGRVEHDLHALIDARRPSETFDYRVTRADGSERWLSSRVFVSYAADGRAQEMVAVTLDITEQQRVERERAALVEREQSARLEAEAASRAKDEFLAMLGHELRNPLSAIASAVEVLNRVDANAPLAVDARHIIARQTRHLAHMMDDLLDVARVISGKVLLSKGPLDLGLVARRIVETLSVTGEAREHAMTVDADDAWVDADPTRVEQIITNLLTNAIKYTPAGGRVEVRVAQEGGQAVLRVKDSGVGIAPALLPRVFDLFVQGERTLDRRAGGLGIGLTLVRRLVQLHGGTIEAQSTPGQGSEFVVRLPAIEPPEGRARARAAAQPLPASRRRRVGVIEDNADALAALRTLLELDGHSVWSAADGQAGLDAVLAQRPDVAIVDIGLPGLDGYEVARRSRAGGYAGRMVALSGYGQDSDVKRSLAAGFDAHLVKPVDPDALRRAMLEE